MVKRLVSKLIFLSVLTASRFKCDWPEQNLMQDFQPAASFEYRHLDAKSLSAASL